MSTKNSWRINIFYKNLFENHFKVNFLVNRIKINRIYNTNLNNWNEREGEKNFSLYLTSATFPRAIPYTQTHFYVYVLCF
jgi:hypothetical protein